MKCDPHDDLCHDVRNGCLSIVEFAKHIQNAEVRLNILKQAARIERALTKYELRRTEKTG